MKKVKNFLGLMLGILCVGYVVYKIVGNSKANNIPAENAVYIKAVLYNERNYLPNQKVGTKFSYSYEFFVNGKKYTGNSHDVTLNVGDSTEVVYDKRNPNINRPLYQRDSK